MDFNQIFANLLTSAAIAGGISFVVKLYVEKSLTKHFDRQLEEIKFDYQAKLLKIEKDIELSSQQTKDLLESSTKIFSKIIETTYRFKNTAREVKKGKLTEEKLEELYVLVDQVEECLYANRFDLERINYFAGFHGYKNKCLYFAELAEKKLKEEASLDITPAYKEIEEGFNDLIGKTIIKHHQPI